MGKTSVIVIGTGGMARHHIRTILQQTATTELVGFVEIGEASMTAVSELYEEAQAGACPPFYATIAELIEAQGAPDAAFICTPHKFHLENSIDCLRAGMDVLLEKPMVLNEAEAHELIATRDATGKLLVVAFPGSLSPAIRKAKQLIADGAIGQVTGLSGCAHQRWKKATIGTWRQNPEISGGGFLFDTGSHMINTTCELLNDEIETVAATMDNCGTPVEINSAVSGRTRGGITFGLTGIGNSTHCCSEIFVFGTEGVMRTGIWGERLELRSMETSQFEAVELEPSMGVWEQFLKVRDGSIDNPSPPEVGLRFAKLMDMIRKSAAEQAFQHA